MSQSERKVKINSTHDLPVKHQCQLLSISRSSAYYQSKAPCDEELGLMRHLNVLHLRRLMILMDIRAVYPGN